MGGGPCRTARAVERQATLTATTMACVMTWYTHEGHRSDSLPRAPWCLRKACTSYADMIVHARRRCRRRIIFDTSARQALPHKIPLRLVERPRAATWM